ncbi:MAG TPA: hypothetical protein VEK15_24675 [Vicinamibacteria bacterium]|nr:hypothetical protein [Vicinamibacteria bacterium]
MLRIATAAFLGSILLTGGGPVSDPLVITFTGGNFESDDGAYSHGVAGVVAYLPGTGNIVLDPDGDVKGKNAPRRSVKLNLTGSSDGPLPPRVYDTYFMALNAVGLDCLGSPSATSPRDLALNECIQTGVAVNDIEGSGYLLRCGQSGADLDTVGVTCEVVDAGACQQWSVESGATLHCALFRSQRNKIVRTHDDPYDVPFIATVVRQ